MNASPSGCQIRSHDREDPDMQDRSKFLLSDKSPEAAWYAERAGGALGKRERDAARKAAVHASTPAVACFDTLGRPFLTVAHNRFLQDGAAVEERLATHVVTDVEGNQ